MNTTTPCATQARYLDTRIAATGCLSGRRLRRAIDYVHAHLQENVRLEDIAAAAGLSAFHFSRAFKSTIGLTPHGYLMFVRVERAKALLSRCDRTMTEIAAEAGFSDQSHMSKVFRRLTGCTPTEFRNRSGALARLSLASARAGPRPGDAGIVGKDRRQPPSPAALDKILAPANT